MTRGRKKYTYAREKPKPEDYPILYPVATGWHAAGDGWAVHGNTPDEARQKYHQAERRRQEILAMPPYRLAT